MTRPSISVGVPENELKAGRELDALVAVEVMGWTHFPDRDPCFQWEEPEREGYFPYHLEPFPFSTEMQFAWEVVEKMTAEPWHSFRVTHSVRGHAIAEIASGATERGAIRVEADTVALAICLAALKAVA